MTDTDAFPQVKPGDWIRFGDHWLSVTRVYESHRIQCLFAPSRDAYLRDFAFRDGWWEFDLPSPDGISLDSHARKAQAEILKQGPPYRIVSGDTRIEYEHRGATVWTPHDWPNPSNPPSSPDTSKDSP